MTPFPPDVGTFCTHLPDAGGSGWLVRFYHPRQRLPFDGRQRYACNA